MQLKFKRFTGTRGLIAKGTTYCLEAMLQATPEEQSRITEFDRWGAHLTRFTDTDLGAFDGELNKAASHYTVRDLATGIRCEFKNFNDVLRVELFIAEACKQLIAVVNALATFNGTERVIEVDASSLTLVAIG